MKGPQTARLAWRLCAIAVFCVMPVLLVGLALSNLMDATQASEQASRKREVTAKIVAQIEKHRSRIATPVDPRKFYLASGSDTLARAEIQERAAKLTEQAGGRIIEMQLTGTPEQEAAGAVAIQVSLDIDNKGLLDLLYAVESGLPLLDVTSLSVQTNAGRPSLGGSALHVDMTVRGHWRKATG